MVHSLPCDCDRGARIAKGIEAALLDMAEWTDDSYDWKPAEQSALRAFREASALASEAAPDASREALANHPTNLECLTKLCERLYLCGSPEAMARHLIANGVRSVYAVDENDKE